MSTSIYTTTWITYSTSTLPFSRTWDSVLAACCIACFIVGTIGNILSLIFFVNKRKLYLPTKIYILMTITDTSSCFLVIVVAFSFINGRQASLFQFNWLCDVWSTVWNITPYFSVFLVLILSVVRTISLVNPFKIIKQRVVLTVVFVYLFYLIARIIVPQVMKKSYHDYDYKDTHCVVRIYDYKEGGLFSYLIASNVIQLAMPVIPIIVSCVLSCYCLFKSRNACALVRKSEHTFVTDSHHTCGNSDGSCNATKRRRFGTENGLVHTTSNFSAVSATPSSGPHEISMNVSPLSVPAGKDRQKQATITILLITGIYIVFNIPVFLFYLFFVVEMFLVPSGSKYIFLTNRHVNFYGWNVVFVQCVALNAALNPIVYCWRKKKMRKFYSRYRIENWLKFQRKRPFSATETWRSTQSKVTIQISRP